MQKKEKVRKVKSAKPAQLDSFVLAISDITGVEGEYIKTRNGYIGVLRMPGTDIINYILSSYSPHSRFFIISVISSIVQNPGCTSIAFLY